MHDTSVWLFTSSFGRDVILMHASELRDIDFCSRAEDEDEPVEYIRPSTRDEGVMLLYLKNALFTSFSLDARVATQTGLSARKARNAPSALSSFIFC